jgi:hypothetical protein
MAKSKKSRRARRQEAQKQAAKPIVTSPAPTSVVEAVSATPGASTPKQVETTPANNHKMVNFAREYFYVYQDMRNVLIISVLMFAVLVGLSFAI